MELTNHTIGAKARRYSKLMEALKARIAQRAVNHNTLTTAAKQEIRTILNDELMHHPNLEHISLVRKDGLIDLHTNPFCEARRAPDRICQEISETIETQALRQALGTGRQLLDILLPIHLPGDAEYVLWASAVTHKTSRTAKVVVPFLVLHLLAIGLLFFGPVRFRAAGVSAALVMALAVFVVNETQFRRAYKRWLQYARTMTHIPNPGWESRNALNELERVEYELKALGNSAGQLLHTMHDEAGRLSPTVDKLTQSSSQSRKTTQQIEASLTDVATESERQVNDVKRTTATVDDIALHMATMTSSMEKLRTLTTTAVQGAAHGNEVVSRALADMANVRDAVEAMANAGSTLEQHSASIGEITLVITNIAEQTNLLALNAAIEAARAGDEGRGFAVVAGEIRQLSERSSVAAHQITELITAVQHEIENVTQGMSGGNEKLHSGINTVHEANRSIDEIRAAVQEVAADINEASSSAQTLQTKSMKAAKELAELTDTAMQLKASTDKAIHASREQSVAVTNIAASTADLSDSAKHLKSAARVLE